MERSGQSSDGNGILDSGSLASILGGNTRRLTFGGEYNNGIVFFFPREGLPGFCLLVFCFGGGRGKKHGRKKGGHRKKAGRKKGFITTTHIKFYSANHPHHCYPFHRHPPTSAFDEGVVSLEPICDDKVTRRSRRNNDAMR